MSPLCNCNHSRDSHIKYLLGGLAVVFINCSLCECKGYKP